MGDIKRTHPEAGSRAAGSLNKSKAGYVGPAATYDEAEKRPRIRDWRVSDQRLRDRGSGWCGGSGSGGYGDSGADPGLERLRSASQAAARWSSSGTAEQAWFEQRRSDNDCVQVARRTGQMRGQVEETEIGETGQRTTSEERSVEDVQEADLVCCGGNNGGGWIEMVALAEELTNSGDVDGSGEVVGVDSRQQRRTMR
ncbi:hypothetical protein Syun_031343 [Stephania yunnanensis]|uniref:Uncharacterized protein n=1 Tax=Stephania yunnanensis TaxID=152371 RepID=A0AAP0DTV0_9MAGN